MSYLQGYGHPAVLTNPQGDNEICVWSTQPANCDTSKVDPRFLKRRHTNNKKERRRTHSLNTAFAELRSRIRDVPRDTKLSKIKILKYATLYIQYLVEVRESLENGTKAPPPFTSLVVRELQQRTGPSNHLETMDTSKAKKASGRTGWPLHVWVEELNREKLS